MKTVNTPFGRSRKRPPRSPLVSSRSMARCLCGATLILLSISAAAQSARGLVRDGNRHYASGDYAKALESYGKAAAAAPESPIVAFDRGDALFKQGEFAKAKEAFEKAAEGARSLPVEARCRYNLGNVEFRLAQRQRDADPQKAIAGYERAIRQYRDALRLDPDHADAAHNLEVARVLMRALQEELRKDPQGVDQRQKMNRETREELQKVIREQENNAAASRDLDKKQKGADKENLSGEMRQAEKDQRETQQKTRGLSDAMKDAPKPQDTAGQRGQSPSEKAREEMEKALQEQESAADSLQKEQPGKAEPSQDKAAEHLKKALEELGGEPGRERGQEKPRGGGEKGGSEGPARAQKQTPPAKESQAHSRSQTAGEPDQKPRDETAQDILREERRNQEKQMRQVQSGTAPVDKDW